MKPLLKLVNSQQDRVFQLLRVDEPYFFPHWHFHPEFEIMLVQEGTGMRFVGDSMERFKPGDLVFYGPNIPHHYRSDIEYYERKAEFHSKAFVVYFKSDFLGCDFWETQNISSLKRLFSNAGRGMRFTGSSMERISNVILKLDENGDGFEKILDLLHVLKLMADSREYELLSSEAFTGTFAENDGDRINKVYQFIMDNYAENPSLEEVAEIAHLSPTAFCRFFKSHTNKTYIQFLNEIKIGNACKMLMDNNISISQICYSIGFNNTAHFNNQFKRIIGVTPSQYRQEHVEYKQA